MTQGPDKIKCAIEAIVERLKSKHGHEPRLGFEWEFQLLDSTGNTLDTPTVALLKDALKDHPHIYDVYREQGYSHFEIATAPQGALEAADTLAAVQMDVAALAKEKGWHLSSHPTAGGNTSALHINSSLVPPGIAITPVKDATYSAVPSAFALDHNCSRTNAATVNAVNGVLQVTRDTPLWSFYNEEDLERIIHSKTFTVRGGYAKGKEHILTVRNNESKALGAHEGSPLPQLAEAYHAHLEERLPGARMDPHVAAFRSTLGMYHGLENPIHESDALVSVEHMMLSDAKGSALPILPDGKTNTEMWATYQKQHLLKGSIPNKYIGDLYDAETLSAIEARARNPHVLQFESPTYQWKPEAAPLVPAKLTVNESPVELPRASAPLAPWEQDKLGSSSIENAHALSLSPLESHPMPTTKPAPVQTGAVTAEGAALPHGTPHVAPPQAAHISTASPAPHIPKAPSHVNGATAAESNIVRNIEKEGVEASKHAGRGGKIIAGIAMAGALALAGWAWWRSKEKTEKNNDNRNNRMAFAQNADVDATSPATRSDGQSWSAAVTSSRSGIERAL